jgi:hypothetical protein
LKKVLSADLVDESFVGIFKSAGLKADYSKDNSLEKFLKKLLVTMHASLEVQLRCVLT